MYFGRHLRPEFSLRNWRGADGTVTKPGSKSVFNHRKWRGEYRSERIWKQNAGWRIAALRMNPASSSSRILNTRLIYYIVKGNYYCPCVCPPTGSCSIIVRKIQRNFQTILLLFDDWNFAHAVMLNRSLLFILAWRNSIVNRMWARLKLFSNFATK